MSLCYDTPILLFDNRTSNKKPNIALKRMKPNFIADIFGLNGHECCYSLTEQDNTNWVINHRLLVYFITL